MSATGANNVQIAPVNALWRIETSEDIDFTGLDQTIAGKYFNIDSAKDATQYYVWYNDSVASDPAPAGRTAIAVTITSSETPASLATATQTAIDGNSDFNASVSGSIVSVERVAVGRTTATVDVDSGVTISICRNGQDLDLGLLNGNVELSFAPANFIVQAHQTGVTPRAALFQGIETAEVSLELLETTDSNLKEIYGLYGTTGFTPMSGTEVYGVGTSRQGNNLLVDAARLELKPVNAANDQDNTTLMLAIPIPDTLVFSGEDPKTLSATFQGFVDERKDSRVSGLLFGDPTQTGI